MTRIVVSKLARLDIAHTSEWYEDNLIERAEGFAVETQRAIEGLLVFPMLYPALYLDIRMVSVSDYPYQVWYRYDETTSEVTVMRVIHERADRSRLLGGT